MIATIFENFIKFKLNDLTSTNFMINILTFDEFIGYACFDIFDQTFVFFWNDKEMYG